MRQSRQMTDKPDAETFDPSKPLDNARHEAFVQLIIEGKSQSDAYRTIYPDSLKWQDESVHEKASHVAALDKVKARITFLQNKAAEDALMTRQELLTLHTNAVRKRYAAPSRFLNVTPDGDVSLNLDPEKMKDDPSIKKLVVRVEASEEGDGKNDARVLSMEFHDYLDVAKEYGHLCGFAVPEKADVSITSTSLERFFEEISNTGGKWWRRRSTKNGLRR